MKDFRQLNSQYALTVFLIMASISVVASSVERKNISQIDSAGSDPIAIEQAYKIAEQSDQSDDNFGSSRVSARMVLTNSSGQSTERQLMISTLERAKETEGDKSLVEFHHPRDLKGVKLLSHAKVLVPDNQWLFLPAIKRVKRVSSANKSGPFVGSEFSIEDFTASVLSKYKFSYIGKEAIDGLQCDVIARVPLYKKSGYKVQKVWIDTHDYQVRKVEYYDRGGAFLKTLTLGDYKDYDGIWRAHTLHMLNHQTKKSTKILFDNYDFDVDYSEADFKKGALSRR